MIKALSLAAVIAAAAGPALNSGSDEPSLTESRVVVSAFIVEEVAKAVQEMEPQNCVDCRWHQKCDYNEHTADLIENGPRGGAHSTCVVNPDPWCSGHPWCGAASAIDEATVEKYALRVADGDDGALRFLQAHYSSHLRYNGALETHEIFPCPNGRPFVTVPAEWFHDSRVGE